MKLIETISSSQVSHQNVNMSDIKRLFRALYRDFSNFGGCVIKIDELVNEASDLFIERLKSKSATQIQNVLCEHGTYLIQEMNNMDDDESDEAIVGDFMLSLASDILYIFSVYGLVETSGYHICIMAEILIDYILKREVMSAPIIHNGLTIRIDDVATIGA